jgi:hypothetical protein
MSEEQSNFKVTDRRLFNPDGSPRDVPPDERPAEPPPVAAAEPDRPAEATDAVIDATYGEAPRSEAPRSEAPRSEAPGPVEQEAGEVSHSEAEEIPGAEDPASFTNFIMSIASNAASSLGMMEHPVTGKREVDLELGKHWIDILGMLEEKTRNNLLPKEKQILESLLADLRMQYVSLTSAVAAKARSFSSQDITGG